MKFEFATAGRIIFGSGTANQIGSLANGLGHCAMIVTGKTIHASDFIFQDLDAHGLRSTRFRVAKEPTIPVIMDGSDMARDADATWSSPSAAAA